MALEDNTRVALEDVVVKAVELPSTTGALRDPEVIVDCEEGRVLERLADDDVWTGIGFATGIEVSDVGGGPPEVGMNVRVKVAPAELPVASCEDSSAWS